MAHVRSICRLIASVCPCALYASTKFNQISFFFALSHSLVQFCFSSLHFGFRCVSVHATDFFSASSCFFFFFLKSARVCTKISFRHTRCANELCVCNCNVNIVCSQCSTQIKLVALLTFIELLRNKSNRMRHLKLTLAWCFCFFFLFSLLFLFCN